jgi:hypothetical protein
VHELLRLLLGEVALPVVIIFTTDFGVWRAISRISQAPGRVNSERSWPGCSNV